MLLDGKPFDHVGAGDLQALVDNKVPEGKTIEYKESLPGNSESEKKEFLADVSSFANTSGGHLVYGIREQAGVPCEVCGLGHIDADAEIRRLDGMIRNGIEPRIPNVGMKAIELPQSGVVIVIRVPQSYVQPHMVTYQGSSRFYARHSGGKYSLDVHELRAAFALSEANSERIRGFRAERLARIVARETPLPLDITPKIVLHMVPLGSLAPGRRVDFSALNKIVHSLRPMYAGGYDIRYNFDGLMAYCQSPGHPYGYAYVQVFHNGSLEAVDALLLAGKKHIPSLDYEEGLLSAVSRYLSVQKAIGAGPPIFIMHSLLGVRGFALGTGRIRQQFDVDTNEIDRDTLIVPEVIADSFECDVHSLLRPVFDAIWNAAGWPSCMHYDHETGAWAGTKHVNW